MINQLLAELEMANRKLKEKDKEIEQLKELCDKYEEEHSTTFEEWKKEINIIDELEKYINEVNNMITTRDIKENVYICGRYDENLDILDKLNELRGDNK